MSHRWFFLKANLDITLENIQHMPDDHSSVNLCGWLQIICQHLNTILILQTPIQSKMVRGRNILSQCSGWFPARHVGMAGTCGNLRICGWTTYQPLLRELYNWELGFKKIVANLCISTMSTDYCTWMGVIIIYLAYFQWASGLDKNLPCPWPWRALVINSPKIVMRSMCWHAVRGREVLIL